MNEEIRWVAMQWTLLLKEGENGLAKCEGGGVYAVTNH